jgi:hypothetical protein
MGDQTLTAPQQTAVRASSEDVLTGTCRQLSSDLFDLARKYHDPSGHGYINDVVKVWVYRKLQQTAAVLGPHTRDLAERWVDLLEETIRECLDELLEFGPDGRSPERLNVPGRALTLVNASAALIEVYDWLEDQKRADEEIDAQIAVAIADLDGE